MSPLAVHNTAGDALLFHSGNYSVYSWDEFEGSICSYENLVMNVQFSTKRCCTGVLKLKVFLSVSDQVIDFVKLVKGVGEFCCSSQICLVSKIL